MKTTNLVIAILYTLLAATLLVPALIVIQSHPYEPAAIVFLTGPIVLCWISFLTWTVANSWVKTANVVIAIIYTILLTTLVVSSLGDKYVLLSSLIFAVPIGSNWLSYYYWPSK